MSPKGQLLARRGSAGVSMSLGPPLKDIEIENFKRDENSNSRAMTFSKDGKWFSWCTNTRVAVTSDNFSNVQELNKVKTTSLSFSPKGTYLATWEPYTSIPDVKENSNLDIWDSKTGTCLKSFIQKKQAIWKPQWSDDEHICARNVNNEVHFYEDSNFERIVHKIHIQKVADFSLSPSGPPYYVAVFVPGAKGQPSFVRLYKYPIFEGSSAVIAQKSFYKAESTSFFWNKTGKDIILLTSVDVDKSGASYYGEQHLYYLSIKGETAKIILGKDGPVYSLEWSPNSVEFCVVYGTMPARATIYNLKCNPVFDLGSGPRSEVHYTVLGDNLCLCGFGNLNGQIEIWDRQDEKMLNKFQATDSTCLSWSPDGEYILTATTSPRLRIGNGYRVWHYTGSLLREKFLDKNEELWDMQWQPFPEGTFKHKPIIQTPVKGIKSAKPEASKEVYRPPGAQGKAASFKLHDEEPPKDDKPMKNKKKKAKKPKKAQDKNEESNGAAKPGDKPQAPEKRNGSGKPDPVTSKKTKPASKEESNGAAKPGDKPQAPEKRNGSGKPDPVTSKKTKPASKEESIGAAKPGDKPQASEKRNDSGKPDTVTSKKTKPASKEESNGAAKSGDKPQASEKRNDSGKPDTVPSKKTKPASKKEVIDESPRSKPESTGNPETDKRKKNILKKLDQIKKLKDEKIRGKALDENQIGKINNEKKLLQELKNLHL